MVTWFIQNAAAFCTRLIQLINIFCHDSVEEIIESLENETAENFNEWCKNTVKKMKEASPLSLKVTLRSGRFQSLDQCLAREYQITLTGISKQVSNDFSEGVRARILDKDFASKWNPHSLEDVSEDMVDSYFSTIQLDWNWFAIQIPVEQARSSDQRGRNSDQTLWISLYVNRAWVCFRATLVATQAVRRRL